MMSARPQDQDSHDLLPFYVAGTLQAVEAGEFERHLAHCRSCQEDRETIEALRRQMLAHGEAYLAPHPPAEAIARHGMGLLTGDAGSEVQRHLAFCVTCWMEHRVVRGEVLAGRRPGVLRRLPRLALPWRRALPWAVAALVAVALVAWWRAGERRSTGVVTAYYLEPATRDGAVVTVPRDAGDGFQLVLPVDVTPESYPLSLVIRAADGSVRYSASGIRNAYQEAFLFVYCAHRDFPDGEYVATVSPAAPPRGGPPIAVEYRFRVGS
jgi:hypothetical protein